MLSLSVTKGVFTRVSHDIESLISSIRSESFRQKNMSLKFEKVNRENEESFLLAGLKSACKASDELRG